MSINTQRGPALLAALATLLMPVANSVSGAEPRAFRGVEGPFEILAAPLVDCGEFQVLGDWWERFAYNVRLNKQGDEARVRLHIWYDDGIYYNSEDPSIMIEGGPAEFSIEHIDFVKDQLAVTGPVVKVKVPGGQVIHDVGRLVFDLQTGEVLFSAGQHEVFEGETLLCDILAAP